MNISQRANDNWNLIGEEEREKRRRRRRIFRPFVAAL